MKKNPWGKRLVSTLCAAAMVTCGLPAVALATERPSTDKDRMPTTAQNTNGYVTGVCLDAPRDMATLEILGVSSINDAQGNNDLAGYGTGYTTVPGTAWDKAYYAYDHDWNHTQYWLFASAYNENSNPFWINRGIGATVSDDQKGVVAGKLMGSLAAYGTDETSTAVWDMMPNLFMASSASSLSSLSSITPDGTVDEKFEGYQPLAAANTLDNFTSYIAGMKAVATAADTAAKGSDGIAGTDDDLTLRYGSATEIANKMQQWLLGTQGYILENIENGTVQKKTIAVLGSSSSQGGGGGQKGGARSTVSLLTDTETPTSWTLSTTYNEAYEGIISSDASYEGVVLPSSIANNLATTLGKSTVTTEELSQADVIVANSSDVLAQLIAAGLGDKAYYGGTNSGVIHSAANAELFQQMPRVLPCLYPELLDQSDYMAYMYDEFYHLNSGSLLYEACVNLFGCGNGVLNWAATDSDGDGTISADEKMTWTTSDFEGYSAANVEKIYEEGWNYLQGTTTDISGATVDAIAAQTYTGSAIEPAVTVTFDGRTLKAGSDYKVTYSNNTNVGTATVTITGNGSYSGTVTTTFEIEPAPPAITTQPVDYIGAANSTATFSIAAEGNGLTYKWEYSTDGETWKTSSLTGASVSAKLTAKNSGRMYRCVVTNEEGLSVTSDAVSMKVATLSITTQPASYTGELNSTATFSVVAEGYGELTYKWQYSADNGATWKASTLSAAEISAKLTSASNGRMYRCTVSDTYGNMVTTDAVSMTVNAAELAITTQPKSVTVAAGKTATISVTATGEGLTYVWYYKNAGGTWKVSSLKTASISVKGTTAANGRQYLCKVYDKAGNMVKSKPATITVS